MDIWWKILVLVLVLDAVASCVAAWLITKRIDILTNKVNILERCTHIHN